MNAATGLGSGIGGLLLTVYRHSFARFLLVGLVNTAVGLGIIFFCAGVLGFDDVSANATGYGVGIVVSFVLNRRFTFAHRGSALVAFLRFLMTVGIAYLLNLATVMACIRLLSVNHYVAHVVGIIPYNLSTYVLSRIFVFRKG